MKISTNLNKHIERAVQISMRIEGYKPAQLPQLKQQVKALMEQHRVQVSIQRK